MARKTQISREIILEAAFQMLLRDGYSTINITSLAREIGCSTQPIAWHFGNMDGLRDALFRQCLMHIRDHFAISGNSASSILEETQRRYILLAFDYPNLYKYLYMTDHESNHAKELVAALRFPNYEQILCQLQQEHGVSQSAAQRYLLDVQLYVHGIAACAAANIPVSFKNNVLTIIHDANEVFLEKMIKTIKD